MLSYRAFEHTLHVNISLSLPPSQQKIPDYTILVQDRTITDLQVRWIHSHTSNGGCVWLRLGRIASDYLFRFIDIADFLINVKKNKILCFPAQDTKSSTIEHLLLDQVLPRILSQKNFLVLHAGANLSDFGAIGFLGKTGCGKSTLSAHYGQHGYSIITDDCLVLQKERVHFRALPSYPAIRLNPDSAAVLTHGNEKLLQIAEYSDKLRVNPSQGRYVSHKRPEVLRALFILVDPDQDSGSDAVTIEQCSMREAFSQLIENIFRLDPTDTQSSINEFININTFVSTIPVYRLKYVRRHSAISDVMQAIFELLNKPRRNFNRGSYV